jgi:hypothetical protein
MPDSSGFRLGTAFVEVEPKMDGFTEKVAAETDKTKKISVPVVPDTKGFTEKVAAETEAAGAESGAGFKSKFAGAVGGAGALTGNAGAKAGEEMGSAGEKSAGLFTGRFKDAFSGHAEKLADAGKEAGNEIGGGMGSGLSKATSLLGPFGMAAGVAGGSVLLLASQGEKLENAQIRLETAMKNSGLSFEDNKAAIEKNNQALAKYGVTSDQAETSLAALIPVSGNTQNAINLSGDAANLAAQKNISYADASKQVTLAATGNAKQLKQLGITQVTGATQAQALGNAHKLLTDRIQSSGGMAKFAASQHMTLEQAQQLASGAAKGNITDYNKLAIEVLPKSASAADKAAQAHQLLADKMGGAAAAKADTLGGKMAALKAKLEDGAESLGQKLLPALTKFADYILSTVIPNVAKVAQGIGKLVMPVVSLFFTGLGTIFKALTSGPMKEITLGIGGIGAAWLVLNTVMAINPFVAVATAVVILVGIVTKYHTQILDFIEGTWNKISAFLKQWWPLALAIATGGLSLIIGVVVKYHNQIFSFVEDIWNKIWGFLKNWWYVIILGVFTGGLGLIVGLVIKYHNQIWAFIQQIWGNIKSFFSNTLASIRTTVDNAWLDIERDVHTVWNRITGFFTNTLPNTLKSAFTNAVNGVSGEWGKLEGIFKTPVNFLINTVYTNGIERLWNDVAGKIPGIPNMPNVAGLATGGVLPGYAPGQDTVPAMLSPGEAVLTPGAALALGHDTIESLNAAHRPAGAKPPAGHFGWGWNPISDIKQAYKDSKSLVDKGFDIGKALADLATGNTSGFLSSLTGVIGSPAAGDLGKLLIGIPTTMVKDVLSAIKSKLVGGAGASTASPANLPGSAADWIHQGLAAVGRDNAAWFNGISQIASSESGGNPTIVNTYDINAQEGHPSMGLLQFIQPTFDEYAIAGHKNILNPVDQVIADARPGGYIDSAYGGIGNVPGLKSLAGGGAYVGYANGGHPRAGSVAMVGERGRELVQFGADATVIPHEQTEQMLGGRTVNITFTGTEYPTPQQIQNLKMEMGLALQGVG